MVKNIDELAQLIAKRDAISLDNAYDIIWDCRNEIKWRLASNNWSIMDIEDIIADYLGLEPDYLEVLL